MLVVPELVIDETLNKWREKTEEEVEKLRVTKKALEAYGLEVQPPSPAEVEARIAKVEEDFRGALSGTNCLVPSYPQASHADVVKRALARDQPFDSRGKDGYRDSLLWETVLELATNHEVLLVSDDRRAFAGTDKEKLSPALDKEACERIGRAGAVTLLTSVSAAAAIFAAENDEVRRRVGRLLELASFRTVFREHLETTVEFQELSRPETDLLIEGVGIEMASISELVNLGRTEIVSANAVDDDLGLVELSVDSSLALSFFTSAEEARKLSGRADVLPVQGDWDDFWPLERSNPHLATYRFALLRVSVAIRLDAGAIDRMELIDVRLMEEDDFADAPTAFDPLEAEFEDPRRIDGSD
jgi:hypothetical protein